jgi:hypothetical protein
MMKERQKKERKKDVGFIVPYRKLMVGEHNIIRWGQSSPIRLVFWVELGPEPVVAGSCGPKAWSDAGSWVGPNSAVPL